MLPLKLIVNPVSGGKRTTRWVPPIEACLRAEGIDVNISYTAAAGDGIALAAAAVDQGYQRFGVIGGDGTVNEVVNGLVQASPEARSVGPLAIFPAGSGNDLAATLGLTTNPQKFARQIAQTQTKPIDICSVLVQTSGGKLQRFFINNLGLGLEAAVTQRYEKVHWVQGHLRYVVAALQTIFNYQATEMSAHWSPLVPPLAGSNQPRLAHPDYLRTDIRSQAGETVLVTVGNNRRAGGGFYLTPDAQLDDGLIDAGILRSVSKLNLLQLLGQALQGKHIHDPAITMLRTPELTVTCHEPLPVQADGELLAMNATQIDVTIHTQPLQVYI